MITLKYSRKAWGSPEFNQRFKSEVESLRADQLPLQEALQYTSYVSNDPFSIMVLTTSEDTHLIRVKAGVLYSGIVAGCSCVDDPTPISTVAEHCELQFEIDKRSSAATVTLLPV